MRPAAAILAGGIRRFEPEPPAPPPPPPEGACSSCGDRGHTYGLGARVGLGYNGIPDIVIGAGQ